MNPADANTLHQALASEGVLVGKHEQAHFEITVNLRTLSAHVAHIGDQVNQVSTHLTQSDSGHQPQPSQPISDPFPSSAAQNHTPEVWENAKPLCSSVSWCSANSLPPSQQIRTRQLILRDFLVEVRLTDQQVFRKADGQGCLQSSSFHPSGVQQVGGVFHRVPDPCS